MLIITLPEAHRWLGPKQGSELRPGSPQNHLSPPPPHAHGPHGCRYVCRAGLDPVAWAIWASPASTRPPASWMLGLLWACRLTHLWAVTLGPRYVSGPFPGEWTFPMPGHLPPMSLELSGDRRAGSQGRGTDSGMGDPDPEHTGVCLGEAGQEGNQQESTLGPWEGRQAWGGPQGAGAGAPVWRNHFPTCVACAA